MRVIPSSAGTSFTSSALHQSVRSIRNVIPPRPLVTTLLYLDSYGRPIRSKATETPLSLVRTRDNKFWLQRVLENGEVVRWHAIGLSHLKHATSFETYSLNDIDEFGGVVIPADVQPTAPQDPPGFLDAVYYIMRVTPTGKFTRKDRRSWHRRLFSDWRESPEKYMTNIISFYGLPLVFVMWLGMRGAASMRNNRSFWDKDVYTPYGEESTYIDPFDRLREFSDRHPEHEGHDDIAVTLLSPGQARLSSARAELRESDHTDPHYHTEFFWKVRHCRYYGHWPKGIAE